MRRVVSVLLASTFLVALAAPVAGAATPIDERRVRSSLELESFVIPADPEFACDFDVMLEDVEGRITHVFITEDRHGNVLERVIYHTLTRYTNLSNDQTYERRFDSVVNITTFADGSARVTYRNDALFVGGEPSSLAAGIYLVDHGRVLEEYDTEGAIVVQEILSADEVIDLCAELS